MMMGKNIITLVLCFFLGIYANAQAPDWSVNENEFEYTMSFVAFLNVDGTNLSSTNDMVGAFVNGVSRGTTNLIYVASKDRYYAYLTIFSNLDGETIEFKVYDASNNQILDIPKTINFEINGHYGNLGQAFSFASPTLNNEAAILNFNFKDIVIQNRTINGYEMTLYVEDGLNVSALNAIFELSDGAKLHMGSTVIESENNVLNFSTPLQFQVLSEDESKLESWTIAVGFNGAVGNVSFYKKDAVCYNGGAIKITSTESGSNVSLLKDQVGYATKTINNGEVTFNDLETGDYLVKVNGIEKQILINLKE